MKERKFRLHTLYTLLKLAIFTWLTAGWLVTFTYTCLSVIIPQLVFPSFAIVLYKKTLGGGVDVYDWFSLFWWTSCRLSLACFCGQQHNTRILMLIVCLMDIVTVNYNSSERKKRRERSFFQVQVACGVMLLLSNKLLAIYTIFFRNFRIGFLFCLWCITCLVDITVMHHVTHM